MPQSFAHLPFRLRRLAWLARARLIWERYVPVFARPAIALCGFLILTWIGVWDIAGDPLRLIALIATAILIGRAVWQARQIRPPTRSDALRRLEATAALEHRPLDALGDAPILAPELWPRHLQEAQTQASQIRKVGRQPVLSPMDRYGLRFVLPVLMILALFVAFGFGLERTRRALSPGWLPMTNPYAVEFEAWVDPPDYTGRPPIYAQDGEPIRAPAGSSLVVRVAGASALPRPRYRQDDGAQRFLTPSSLGRNGSEVRTTIERSGQFDWRIGPRLQRYVVNVDPDLPPDIQSLDPPEADKRDRLVLRFDASDDYGVERVLLEMVELSDRLIEETAFEGDTSEIDTNSGGFKDATGRSIKQDLTRHPLAGRKVIARLVAVDGAGQRGVSEPFYTTIPDRIFVEPLAKAIIEQRGLLLSGAGDYAPAPREPADNDASDGTFDTFQTAWRLGRAPAPVQRTVQLIDAVTDAPDPTLFNDPVVYIGLRHVGKSLRYARSAKALQGLPEHMWSLAMRAEFGVLGTALQEMQEAEANLREGIARRASEREVDTLFERYNLAVDAYMEELLRNATIGDGGAAGGGIPMGSTDQIQELLDAIEEANRIGDTEGARRALAQLAELLENMQMQINPGGEGGDAPSDDAMSEELRDALEELAESLGEQRELQDQTRQAERDALMRDFGGEGRDDTLSAEELAERQDQLEQLIEALRERLGETAAQDGEAGTDPSAGGREAGTAGEPDGSEAGAPESALDRAMDAMRQAQSSLGQGAFGEARSAQSDAIEALRDAGDQLALDLANDESAEPGNGADPIGRGMGGVDSDNAETDIDTRDNAERSREILDELRRRAAEAERDAQEKDYLDRLLRQY